MKTTLRRLSDPALAACQGHNPPKDAITPDYAGDLVAIRDYREGRIGLMDLMTLLGASKRHALQAAPGSIYSVVRAPA